MKNVLDVGSGSDPKHYWLGGDDVYHFDIDKQRATVQGDAQKLPFADNTFNEVLCRHCLEHVENPLAVLRELKRVAIEGVFVQVPNATFYKISPSGREKHIYSWNVHTLHAFLSRVFDSFRIEATRHYRECSTLAKIRTTFYFLTLGNNELTAWCDK